MEGDPGASQSFVECRAVRNRVPTKSHSGVLVTTDEALGMRMLGGCMAVVVCCDERGREHRRPGRFP